MDARIKSGHDDSSASSSTASTTLLPVEQLADFRDEIALRHLELAWTLLGPN
jgi:hypothetical protein